MTCLVRRHCSLRIQRPERLPNKDMKASHTPP